MAARLEHVLTLESRLLDPHTRRDPAEVASLLDPDSWGDRCVRKDLEPCRSPRRARERSGAARAGERHGRRRISDTVVLVTYSAGDSRRSSLWVSGADGWRLLFHQGTSTRGRGIPFAIRILLSVLLARPLRAVVVSLARRRLSWR